MTPEPATSPGRRFPAEIIGHAPWLHHVFSLSLSLSLSLRHVEPIPAERGVAVTHGSIRQWRLGFGGDVARRPRRRAARAGRHLAHG